MNNLVNLVPPVELCEQIPEGEFEDSAMAWYDFHGVPILRWRDNLEKLDGVRPIQAPTMDEILEGIWKIETLDTITLTRITNGQSLTTNTMKNGSN